MGNNSDINTDLQGTRGGALYEDANHAFIWLGMEEAEEEGIVQVNQYLIKHGRRLIILDPGGVHTYARVVANLSRYVNLGDIDTIFYSHQDPDVCSGAGMWLSTTRAEILISKLWVAFLPHFGSVDPKRIKAIPDQGMRVDLGGGDYIDIIPAHFLHSIGNFSVYDSRSKILFSGDIGASVFRDGKRYMFVDRFDAHLPNTEGFHKRYMVSNAVCREWVKRVSRYEIRAIAPQHGAILAGENVARFLDWFGKLSCGTDQLNAIYGG